MARWWLAACVAVLVGSAFCRGQPAIAPANLDLERGTAGESPSGWFTPVGKAALSDQSPKEGKLCAVLSRSAAGGGAGGMANLMQSFDAAPYRGKRIAYSASVRVDGGGVGEGAPRAQLWLRVDRPPSPAKPNGDPQPGFFNNMSDRPITSPDWAEHRIVGDVAPDAANICIGMMLLGGGAEARAMLDAATVEIIGDAGPGDAPAAPLSDRALINLTAFTRLYGYVRFFHPSDQAALPSADWDAVAITGVNAVESATTPDELAAALLAVFRPYAPTLRVETRPFDQPFDLKIASGLAPAPDGAATEPDEIIAWVHAGIVPVAVGDRPNLYSSKRTRLARLDPEAAELLPPLGTVAPAGLGGGVWCSLPIVLYIGDGGTTLPKAETPPRPRAALQEAWSPSGNDRGTRLADVVIAWNILQHSYPYFDVVQTDWPGALAEALRAAATDADQRAFHATLLRLVAKLHDGHGNVYDPSDSRAFPLPIDWDRIQNELVITKAGPAAAAAGIKPGDTVASIDEVPSAKLLADASELVSGATPGWIVHRALDNLRRSESASPARLDLRDPAGAVRSVSLARGGAGGKAIVAEDRPDKIAELKPGIYYVDIDRINDADFKAALPRLEKATGIVFDLRGYPNNLSIVVLAHLIDKPITCARWNVPVFTRPDRENVQWRFSNWSVQPIAPRLSAKVAFITAGSAISYAETYMGMVENYKLAEIVGQPTAGTNGNVNSFTLPGGYAVMYTGMKVLKHDKSQHHGIGIRPTVPVERTIKGVAEGRDEFLEKGVEVVSGPGDRK